MVQIQKSSLIQRLVVKIKYYLWFRYKNQVLLNILQSTFDRNTNNTSFNDKNDNIHKNSEEIDSENYDYINQNNNSSNNNSQNKKILIYDENKNSCFKFKIMKNYLI